MTFTDKPVQVVRRFYHCPACEWSNIISGNMVYMSNPPQYPYKCAACGHDFTLPEANGSVHYISISPEAPVCP